MATEQLREGFGALTRDCGRRFREPRFPGVRRACHGATGDRTFWQAQPRLQRSCLSDASPRRIDRIPFNQLIPRLNTSRRLNPPLNCHRAN